MPETISLTQERILSAAMDEFLQRGFRSASLRSIVKTAGVTTGAFYGYYDSNGPSANRKPKPGSGLSASLPGRSASCGAAGFCFLPQALL